MDVNIPSEGQECNSFMYSLPLELYCKTKYSSTLSFLFPFFEESSKQTNIVIFCLASLKTSFPTSSSFPTSFFNECKYACIFGSFVINNVFNDVPPPCTPSFRLDKQSVSNLPHFSVFNLSNILE